MDPQGDIRQDEVLVLVNRNFLELNDGVVGHGFYLWISAAKISNPFD
jgi:hypothetical protein